MTLFALKINNISHLIPTSPDFHASLFVDDLQLGCRGPDVWALQAKLQRCLDYLVEWTHTNGFKFSPAKTKVVHFTHLQGMHPDPDLRLDNVTLPYVPSIKFLGLLWDTRLTWRGHVSTLQGECKKLLGLLRSISSHDWGADQYGLLKI